MAPEPHGLRREPGPPLPRPEALDGDARLRHRGPRRAHPRARAPGRSSSAPGWRRTRPSRSWRPSPLSVVCFRARLRRPTPEERDRRNERIMDAVNATGEAYLSHTRLARPHRPAPGRRQHRAPRSATCAGLGAAARGRRRRAPRGVDPILARCGSWSPCREASTPRWPRPCCRSRATRSWASPCSSTTRPRAAGPSFGRCCALDDLHDAKAVAGRLGHPPLRREPRALVPRRGDRALRARTTSRAARPSPARAATPR